MRIGLLIGMEDSFARAFMERARSHEGVSAELATVGGVRLDHDPGYDVLFDRISHEVAFYRAYLSAAHALGVHVINNPVRAAVANRWFDFVVAQRLGISVPKAFVLPQKDYPPTVTPASLRNLEYPIPWETLLASVGGVGDLRVAAHDGWRHAARVRSVAELLHAYDQTGQDVMMLQGVVTGERYVRCVVVGGDRVVLARFDPEYRMYMLDPNYLGEALSAQVVHDAAKVATALGLDLCAVEFSIQGETPTLVDVTANPDLEVSSLTPYFFEKVLALVIDHCVSLGREGRRPPSLKGAYPLYDSSAPLMAYLSEVTSPGSAEASKPKQPRSRKPDATTKSPITAPKKRKRSSAASEGSA